LSPAIALPKGAVRQPGNFSPSVLDRSHGTQHSCGSGKSPPRRSDRNEARVKIGIFLTGQHPPGSDIVAELEGQYAMARLARDRGWDAVATGQHYPSEGGRQP
jgi:hypothetical protein